MYHAGFGSFVAFIPCKVEDNFSSSPCGLSATARLRWSIGPMPVLPPQKGLGPMTAAKLTINDIVLTHKPT